MATYENADICTACGGKCCANMPGNCSPEDVLRLGETDDLKEALLKVLRTRRYAIDWWEGDPREDQNILDQGYYVRPRIVGDRRVFSPSFGGPCTFLTPDTGCQLAAQDRPSGCRELEPQEGGGSNCIAHDGSKRGSALQWLPYNKIVDAAGDIVVEFL